MIKVDEISSFFRAFSALAFPPLCGVCEASAADSEPWLCSRCLESLRPVETPVCAKCGMPTPGLIDQTGLLCGRCLKEPPVYEHARYGFFYDGALRRALIKLKYYGALQVGRSLGGLFVAHFRNHMVHLHHDVIVPVPVHRKRLVSRGFNQSVILARRLSKDSGIPMDRSTFRKVRDTPRQVGLPRAQRLKNLRGSFAVVRRERIEGKTILLVDDVATTGSTITECAATLKSAGAEKVNALVLALTGVVTSNSFSEPIENASKERT